ncbi:hypothetical protein GCM10025857_36130 [Alicyclobacillus contaminans]|nr:hypothetical protein GCM10025857_36130 [Alicyclobacillus contaminans]
MPKSVEQAGGVPGGREPGAGQQSEQEVHQAVCDRSQELPVREYTARGKGERHCLQPGGDRQGERLDPYLYLEYLFERLPNIRTDDRAAMDELLPWSDRLPERIRRRGKKA